jgi:hypothetical protein
MSLEQIAQSVATAVVLAIIFAVTKLFWDVVELKKDVKPLAEWWLRTSLDAIKIATNPTSERLSELADKYIASVTGSGQISVAEKQELIDGLREVMEDKNQVPGKRQSASVSLRFIESRERLPLRRGASH